MTVQHEGARPKRADDAYSDDAPTQVSMHSFPPKTIRRAPSTDQKRVRREMLRGKTANVDYCSSCGLQFDPQEKRDRSERDPNVCAECAGDNMDKNASLQTEATQFDSTAERLNPGDHVRTPTGQTARVVRVRTHETSMGHVYVDTDQGTTVNKRNDAYQIVPHNSQQQEIPGYGVPGANSNKTPFGKDPHNQNERGSDTKCPVCNAVSTVKRQGDHYQCTRCGYQEKFGGAGGTTTTSPTIVKRFSTVNQKSAIARRAEQVVLDTEEQK